MLSSQHRLVCIFNSSLLIRIELHACYTFMDGGCNGLDCYINRPVCFRYGMKLSFKKRERMETLSNLKSEFRWTPAFRCSKSSSKSVKKSIKSALTLFPSIDKHANYNKPSRSFSIEICRKAQLSLMDDVCNTVLKCYESHVISHLSMLPQPIALQLLFDVRFVCALLLARDNKVIGNVNWKRLSDLTRLLFD